MAQAAQAAGAILGCGVEEVIDLHGEEYGHLTTGEILQAGQRGFSGRAALDEALRARLPQVTSTRSTATASTGRVAPRARETVPRRRSRQRSANRQRAPGGDDPPPQPRPCKYCGGFIEENKRGDAVYCKASCRVMACRKRARHAPVGLTAEKLETAFAGLKDHASRLEDGFAARVLVDLEAAGYTGRLRDGSFGATAYAREQLGEFWAVA
jgi:hypothetical protein